MSIKEIRKAKYQNSSMASDLFVEIFAEFF